MCGIAGIWLDAKGEGAGALNARLRAMADRLAHRGPDDEGFWADHEVGIGLAYRRLAIIDLAGGRQPLANEDGTVVTVFNGEIYNYRELREELVHRGHRFRTESDTEVIVHLYEDEGLEFVARLRGMFAIAVWDSRRRQLVLVRDRAGKKPLYYRQGGGEFLFASEIKGLLAAGGRDGLTDPPPINHQAIVDYLALSTIPAPSTIYRDVHMLEPGHRMIVRDGCVAELSPYWQLRMEPKTEITRTDAVDRIDELLRESVSLRLRSDVPVGCFLSGGIDSGLITAMAAQQGSGRLTTLTVGFDDDSFDERPLAREVARRYDTDHHELTIRPNVRDDLATIAQAYDQPYGDSSAIPSYYISREARRLTKVVLNGDGGDEILAGYRRYVGAWIQKVFSQAGFGSARAMWRTCGRVLPAPRRFRSAYAFGHRLIRGLGMEPSEQYLAWSVDGLMGTDLRNLCGDSSPWLDGLDGPERLIRALEASSLLRPAGAPDGSPGCGGVDRMLALDFATSLPNDLLVKIDIATMAHGLEARSPFLDHHLVETVARFPESLKLHSFQTKPLLRELSRRYLPDAVTRAPKRGFEVPLVRWLRGDLHDMAADVILSRSGLLADLFDRTALEGLLRDDGHLDPARWSRRVWLLLMLGMWDRHVYNEARPGAACSASLGP